MLEFNISLDTFFRHKSFKRTFYFAFSILFLSCMRRLCFAKKIFDNTEIPKFLIQFSSFYNLRLQGTNCHGPDVFFLSGVNLLYQSYSL